MMNFIKSWRFLLKKLKKGQRVKIFSKSSSITEIKKINWLQTEILEINKNVENLIHKQIIKGNVYEVIYKPVLARDQKNDDNEIGLFTLVFAFITLGLSVIQIILIVVAVIEVIPKKRIRRKIDDENPL